MKELVEKLGREAVELLRLEIERARMELGATLKDTERAARDGAGGALLVHTGALALTGAAIAALSRRMPVWAAASAVGAGLLLVGGGSLKRASDRWRRLDVAPRATAASLKRDVSQLKQGLG